MVRELESLALETAEPGFIFLLGGEMEWRGKFVGMQDLTLDVLVVSDHISLSDGDTKWDQWNCNIASLTPDFSLIFYKQTE